MTWIYLWETLQDQCSWIASKQWISPETQSMVLLKLLIADFVSETSVNKLQILSFCYGKIIFGSLLMFSGFSSWLNASCLDNITG